MTTSRPSWGRSSCSHAPLGSTWAPVLDLGRVVVCVLCRGRGTLLTLLRWWLQGRVWPMSTANVAAHGSWVPTRSESGLVLRLQTCCFLEFFWPLWRLRLLFPFSQKQMSGLCGFGLGEIS